MELVNGATPPSGGSETMSRQFEILRDRLDAAVRIADQIAPKPVSPVPHQPVAQCYIRNLLKMRRNRGRFFRTDLFADPAWDILLELYAAALGQYRVSVTSVCAGAAVPSTTALRWIKHLEDEGLINRRADPTDGRRQFLELSATGIEGMSAYFQTVPAGSSLI
jgi:DNA-binding MarR family transcriptional regulator